MVVAVDVADDAVHVWSRADDGTVTCTSNPDYRPTCYVAATTADALTDLRARLADDPKIVATAFERVFTSLRDDERTRVLALEMERPSEITTVAREIRTVHEPDGWAPGTFRLYDVDISPKFRYCLDTGTKPTPNDPTAVRALSLSLATPDLAAGDVSTLSVASGWGDDAGVTEREPHDEVVVTVEYDDSGTVRGILESEGVDFQADYQAEVQFEALVARAEASDLRDRIRSATSGRADVS